MGYFFYILRVAFLCMYVCSIFLTMHCHNSMGVGGMTGNGLIRAYFSEKPRGKRGRGRGCFLSKVPDRKQWTHHSLDCSACGLEVGQCWQRSSMRSSSAPIMRAWGYLEGRTFWQLRQRRGEQQVFTLHTLTDSCWRHVLQRLFLSLNSF